MTELNLSNYTFVLMSELILQIFVLFTNFIFNNFTNFFNRKKLVNFKKT